MAEGKQSKYFETAARMDEAFLELLAEKDFEFITVKEICQRAGVNRSTFYLHYETIGDLLDECCEWMVARFQSYIPDDTAAFMKRMRDCPMEELDLLTPQYLTPYLQFIADNQRLFLTHLEHSSELPVGKLYDNLRARVLEPILARYGIPEHDRDYYLRFSIKGYMAIVEEWVSHGCADSIEHVVEVMQHCRRPRN